MLRREQPDARGPRYIKCWLLIFPGLGPDGQAGPHGGFRPGRHAAIPGRSVGWSVGSAGGASGGSFFQLLKFCSGPRMGVSGCVAALCPQLTHQHTRAATREQRHAGDQTLGTARRMWMPERAGRRGLVPAGACQHVMRRVTLDLVSVQCSVFSVRSWTSSLLTMDGGGLIAPGGCSSGCRRLPRHARQTRRARAGGRGYAACPCGPGGSAVPAPGTGGRPALAAGCSNAPGRTPWPEPLGPAASRHSAV